MLGKLTCCCDHSCTFSPSSSSVESCLSTLRDIHPRRWWVHHHATLWLALFSHSECFVTETQWIFLLCPCVLQVTACFAMYIVAMLGIIISFSMRLSVLSRLRYYGFYYYADASVRGVSFKQIGHNSPFHSVIWNKLNLVSLSSVNAYCIWISHDHLGCVCVRNPHLLKYCSTFGSEVHQNSGKSRFTSRTMFSVNPTKIAATNWWSLSYFSNTLVLQSQLETINTPKSKCVCPFVPAVSSFFLTCAHVSFSSSSSKSRQYRVSSLQTKASETIILKRTSLFILSVTKQKRSHFKPWSCVANTMYVVSTSCHLMGAVEQ